MKYVIMIHSNPRPWGHPTGDFLPEHQALPAEQRERLNADFEQLLGELSAAGVTSNVLIPAGGPPREVMESLAALIENDRS